MNTKQILFVVGCPRSGTTLLQQMLHAHPAVAIAPETHFMRRFWEQRKRFGDLRQEENFERLVAEIMTIPEFQEMAIQPADFRRAAREAERSYAALFFLLLQQFSETQGVDLVGEKTPNHLLYMQPLHTFFPQARFIHIVRDPRAVVNSWRHIPWSTGTIRGDAEVWRRYMATARRRPPQRREALYTLYYEQLVAEPVSTLRSICRFLGVAFGEEMLHYYHQPEETVNLEREPWKSAATRPVNQKAVDRWKEELPGEMIAEIEAIAWPEMVRHGYRTETPLPTLLPSVALAALRRGVRDNRARAALLKRAASRYMP